MTLPATLRARLPRQRPRLFERFSHKGAPPESMSPERRRAEDEARAIFARVTALLPAQGGAVDPRALTAVQFALEDLGAVPLNHVSADLEWDPARPRDEDWYDEASWHYDVQLVTPAELPALLGVDWSPEIVADLLAAFVEESERFGGTVPDWLFEQQIADTLHPDPRYGRLQLQVLPKDTAYRFVKEHHRALGDKAKLPPGIMYALGAVRRVRARRPELVAVALAGHPTGRWSGAGDCQAQEMLELHRVASIGGLYTTSRKGERVPLGAASMLTARMMDLLPHSSRTGRPGCLFITYSLASERGTTYLSLVSKGLRPTARLRGRAATSGARSGGAGTALHGEDKIRWEAGRAAAPPDWESLAGVVDTARIRGAREAFAGFERRSPSR